jgi:hypothetical protein
MLGTPKNTEKNSDGAALANRPVARETDRSLVKRVFSDTRLCIMRVLPEMASEFWRP